MYVTALCRIDTGNTTGWQGRVRRGRWKHRGAVRYRSRFYADRKWGGSRQAKRLARRWILQQVRAKTSPGTPRRVS